MVHLLRKSFRAGLLALALVGCRDATGPDLNQLVGEWILITIDGDPLPVVVDQVGEDIAEVTAGLVVLDDDRSFSDATTLRLTISGEVTTETQTAAGTWQLANNGTTVSFAPNDGSGSYSMTWDGEDTLTQIFEGFTLVYERALTALRIPRP